MRFQQAIQTKRSDDDNHCLEQIVPECDKMRRFDISAQGRATYTDAPVDVIQVVLANASQAKCLIL